MPANAVAQLKALIPPPASPSGSPDWLRFREELGFSPPSDYVHLIEDYGFGSFDDFLWVFHPSPREFLDIVTEHSRQLDALRELRALAPDNVPFVVEHRRCELIPWGITDNGDVCYWVTPPGSEPDGWTVAVNESRGPDWERFDGSLSEFLVAVLSGANRSSIFPEDFPSSMPGFHRID